MFCITYEIVTPESAENGDIDESGSVLMTVDLRQAIKALTETRTSRVNGVLTTEFSSYPVAEGNWLTVYNGMEFETGAHESRSLHFRKGTTLSSMKRIARLAGWRD